MSVFDSVVKTGLPLAPKFLVGSVAFRYVAGEELADAIDCIRGLPLQRFGHGRIAFPTHAFDGDFLDQHTRHIGVQTGQSLISRDPAAVQFVGHAELAGFIQHFDDHVLAGHL